MRTPTKASTCIQDLASPNFQQHPVQDTSSQQEIKQKHKPNHQQTGLPPHTALTTTGKKKKKNKAPPPTRAQEKVTPNRSLQKPLDQPYLPRAETKKKMEFNLKDREGDPKHNI